jgi:hypothetical protein
VIRRLFIIFAHNTPIHHDYMLLSEIVNSKDLL